MSYPRNVINSICSYNDPKLVHKVRFPIDVDPANRIISHSKIRGWMLTKDISRQPSPYSRIVRSKFEYIQFQSKALATLAEDSVDMWKRPVASLDQQRHIVQRKKA